jgi:dihydrofolate reductase
MPSEVSGKVFDEMMATGAVIAGRRTIDPAGGWGSHHHDRVPVIVYHAAPEGVARGHVRFVTDGIAALRLFGTGSHRT